jgi:phosphoribosyl-ATP pyrophosphohydrolase/phosphoribosyl-AMP cyclohydrolase
MSDGLERVNPTFDPVTGLVVAVVQDVTTRRVLMVGYMNQEALEVTFRDGLVTFFSRSKQRLWTKGESSGNTLRLREIRQDCDGDALLVLAEPTGPVCHTGADTCFREQNVEGVQFLLRLEEVLHHRKTDAPEDSYTARLLKKGSHKVAQKVGEEAVELVIEALRTDDGAFENEAADLLFHLLLLLVDRGVSLSRIVAVLHSRHR